MTRRFSPTNGAYIQVLNPTTILEMVEFGHLVAVETHDLHCHYQPVWGALNESCQTPIILDLIISLREP